MHNYKLYLRILMVSLKFGGTSMANAKRMLNSASIVLSRSEKEATSLVVSAVAGVTNLLQESIDTVLTQEKPDIHLLAMKIEIIHRDIIKDLHLMANENLYDELLIVVDALCKEYTLLLNAIKILGECPDSVTAKILGLGERFSAPIMKAILESKGQKVFLLDSRDYIIATGDLLEGDPDFQATYDAFAKIREEKKDKNTVYLFPGFICGWQKDINSPVQMGLLGRNGSDFSAAIVAHAMEARKLEFWTDVDGVYTADPKIVHDAIVVDNMSYEEAMELSFFGSKVLHPKTLTPLASKNIEVWSLNSYNPEAPGTRIGKGPFEFDYSTSGAVRGISCLKNTAMISVSGAGMRGKQGIAARIFSAVSRAKVSILLITQSSSEYTITFCVKQKDTEKTRFVLNDEFDMEIAEGLINPIEVQENCAIVSIVGDGMKKKRGVAGTFFDSLASRDINILAIAQGSSERSISVVISGEYGDIAVKVAHLFFFNQAQSIEVFVFGAGAIGGCLLDQIRDQKEELLTQKIDIKVVAIATVSSMMMDEQGLDLTNWRSDLEASTTETNLQGVLDFVQAAKPLNPIFVDCTASDDLPNQYLDIFKAGMHIATPNKRANSLSMDFYKSLRTVANTQHRRFLYETNVGAGLPIIDTLQNLFKSGDSLTGFYGIMSGSLSYIFGRLDEGASFSQAVLEAREKKFTEPDPRDDLGGMDVARKALIIAREAGYELEIEDVIINRVFPEDFDDTGSVDAFIQNLPKLDSYFAEKMAALKKENKVLRMAGFIEDGKCSVGMLEVGPEHPLYPIKDCENAFVFHTARYNPIPLTIRGYGAGAAVTAAGVFGDILRTVSWNLEA